MMSGLLCVRRFTAFYCDGFSIRMVRERPTLFTILHSIEFIVAQGTTNSMDLQPLLSIASFVLVTLVVRPSMATIQQQLS